jgi:hypothetical protein
MDKRLREKFDFYPETIRNKLMELRSHILMLEHVQDVGVITESLKWNEPSYQTKFGSAVRFDWKPKTPEQFAVYFNCRTSLVETFREIYGELFKFEGNRAIVFNVDKELPLSQLLHCISLSLRYKKLKTLPLLGA